jgi:hypothetical protein
MRKFSNVTYTRVYFIGAYYVSNHIYYTEMY